MCGISGVISKNIDSNIAQTAVLKMNQIQSCRGPDDTGIFTDEENGVVLGHNRLSIIDLSSDGHQPMAYERHTTSDKRQIKLCITFNGEIYNFQELKKELQNKGYFFKTKTDTEVILIAYAEWGTECFSKLRGMFAFALWDSENKKLFLVKDRYSIKPLYYYVGSEKLIFASTVKTIKKSGLVPIEKNPPAFISFLLFGSVSLPMTTTKGIQAVPAGSYLIKDSNSNEKIIQYYNPLTFFTDKKPITNYSPFGGSPVGRQLPITQIRHLLEESVNLHLISDAPLGVFLSGGLDSSAIAALATQNRKNSITTLSIIFDEKEFSEEYYSDLVAKQIGSDHRKIKITARDFYDSFDDIFSAMDQPTIDGVNSFFISQATKKAGLKVVLSGLGSDEIFCGYPSFRKAALLRKIQSTFGHRKTLGLAMTPILNFFSGRYKKLSYFLNDDILSFYLGIRGLFTPQETAKILNINEYEIKNYINELNNSLLITHYSLLNSLSSIDLLSYLELKFYLQNQLLKDTDFMSMYHSIEVRVPFLDHPLVEYLSSLSSQMKLNPIKNSKLEIENSRLKPLLAAAINDLLPEEVLNRAKMGFTFPFEKWFKQKGDPIVNCQLPITDKHWSHSWARKVLLKFL